MTKILKIGLVAGVNPIVAPFVKAAIFRAAAESARTVELVDASPKRMRKYHKSEF